MRRIRALLATVALVVGILLAGAGPAQAHHRPCGPGDLYACLPHCGVNVLKLFTIYCP